ncbi:MAG TPA: ATP-binding protein [Parapedobacter sp.]|uniref:sensor histidine kinase n=1 Tax=Parapedobacter sp. TaxID=1958893 RepID=UPI002CE5A3BE|nr:ATP-binding protein [Parapedobacter sp.]HWK57209.1 ATP-binding protein [Parapedobacter sp.]
MNYQFDITPHIVKQLGEQLVSDEITALLELIKNSYDADATYVSIEINTSDEYLQQPLFYSNHQGFIVVEDDGFGMDENTIINSWLIISYSEKRQLKEEKKTTPKGRTPLGDKGLGRLSTQRLADICEIFSNKKDSEGVHIGFNWKDFETAVSLGKVHIQSGTYKPKRKHGTTLVLANLNHAEVWKGQNLEKFKGQVSQIISPYKENRPFEVFIKINGTTIDLDKSNDELRDLAVSRFEFEFDGSVLFLEGKTKLAKFIGIKPEEFKEYLEPDNGRKFFSFLEEKYPNIRRSKDNFFIEFQRTFDFQKDIGHLEIYDGERANPGPFNGKIDEFNFKSGFHDEDIKEIFGEFSAYKDFAQNQTGIKLFRNGFAVKPFGIDGDDWLRLRESQTSGGSYYPLRPANVIGYFAIDEGLNQNLKDKTDREGLISNPYSRNFFTLSLFIRDEINRYQENIRRAYNDFLKTYKTEKSGIKTVSQAFTQLKETQAKTEEVKQDFGEAVFTVDKAIKDSEKIVTAVKSNPMFSTDLEKKTADQVENILNELKDIQNTLQKLEKVIVRAERLNEVIDILEPKIQILEEQLADFSELASLGLTAEAVSHEFASIADRLSERASFYSNRLQNKKLAESDIYVLIEYINTTVNGLKVQLRHLDPALKYNREKKSNFKLSSFFKEEKEYYRNRFEKQGVEFVIDCVDDFSIKINRGKFTQVIDNLIANSEYWLQVRQQKESSFSPKIFVKIETPWVYLYDNGYGIAPAVERQIFEPFVTTKSKGEGRGLGLFIVSQLLDSSGCSIVLELVQNKDKRKFIFAINLSNIMVSNG